MHNIDVNNKVSRFKTPFAFDGNENVIDRENAVKGKEYFCSCGDKVKIKAGEKKQKHFFHLKKNNGLPICSLESNIHKAYKQRFLENKKLYIPELGMIEFVSVELEKSFADNKRKADAIAITKNNQKWIVEFAVTHKIDDEKLQDIIDVGSYNCIEIYNIFPKDNPDDLIYGKKEPLISTIDNHLENIKFEYKHVAFLNSWTEILVKNMKKEYMKGMDYERTRSDERILKINVETELAMNVNYKKGYDDGYEDGRGKKYEIEKEVEDNFHNQKFYFESKEVNYGYNRDLKFRAYYNIQKETGIPYITLWQPKNRNRL